MTVQIVPLDARVQQLILKKQNEWRFPGAARMCLERTPRMGDEEYTQLSYVWPGKRSATHKKSETETKTTKKVCRTSNDDVGGPAQELRAMHRIRTTGGEITKTTNAFGNYTSSTSPNSFKKLLLFFFFFSNVRRARFFCVPLIHHLRTLSTCLPLRTCPQYQ